MCSTARARPAPRFSDSRPIRRIRRCSCSGAGRSRLRRGQSPSRSQPESKGLSHVIGVDGGSTKTDAVVANREGHPKGAGRAGCANWELAGEKAAVEAIVGAIRSALDRADIDLGEVGHIHMGLSGLDWPDDDGRLRAALEPHLGAIPLSLENDSFLGVRAATQSARGVTVSAGSGVCASYLGAEGQKYFYGYFGELGGGTAIDDLALHAVLRAEDGRGPKTALSTAIPTATGHSSVVALLRAMTRDSYSLSHTTIRPSLFQTAAAGDPVAVEVVTTFGRELALLATNLIRKYGLVGAGANVVASGSLFARTGPLLFDVFRQ